MQTRTVSTVVPAMLGIDAHSAQYKESQKFFYQSGSSLSLLCLLPFMESNFKKLCNSILLDR